jgi:ATP-dependent protease ClpP protease subunit
MAKLYWTGDVGYYNSETGEGITPAMVKGALSEAGGSDIEVELSTFGGNFFDGVAILDLLRGYKGRKVGYGSSIVASAGTVISLGFDEFKVKPTTMYMIHNAQGWSAGDHNKMREDADLYERMSNLIADEYVKKTGKKREEIKKLMDDETWLMGQEIVDAGFADGMEDEESKPTSMMLVVAQKQFRDRVTMWARPKSDPTDEVKASIESLIDSGAVDKTSPMPKAKESDVTLCIEKNPIAYNGKVFRSSLRSTQARAAKENNRELDEWATAMIAKIDAKGERKLDTKDDAVLFLKDKPSVFAEVAISAGHSAMLVSEKHTKAVDVLDKFVTMGVTDPVGAYTAALASLEKVETARIEAAMSVFGPKVSPSGAKNKSREFAELALRGVKSDEIEAKIEDVKKNEVFLALRGELFDVNSDWNLVGVVEMAGDRKPEGDKFERHLKL